MFSPKLFPFMICVTQTISRSRNFGPLSILNYANMTKTAIMPLTSMCGVHKATRILSKRFLKHSTSFTRISEEETGRIVKHRIDYYKYCVVVKKRPESSFVDMTMGERYSMYVCVFILNRWQIEFNDWTCIHHSRRLMDRWSNAKKQTIKTNVHGRWKTILSFYMSTAIGFLSFYSPDIISLCIHKNRGVFQFFKILFYPVN